MVTITHAARTPSAAFQGKSFYRTQEQEKLSYEAFLDEVRNEYKASTTVDEQKLIELVASRIADILKTNTNNVPSLSNEQINRLRELRYPVGTLPEKILSYQVHTDDSKEAQGNLSVNESDPVYGKDGDVAVKNIVTTLRNTIENKPR